jgi:hypothetical protein
MIIDKKIIVKLKGKNKLYYSKIGYFIEIGEKEIEVDILDLPKQSAAKVNCKCINCGNIKSVVYGNYNTQTDYGKNDYYCIDCKSIKTKKNNFKIYGVENVSQLNSVKNKKKEKCIIKYGCDYTFQSEKVKTKIKETILEKYGVESPLQNREIINKLKQTNIKKYGFENVFQNEEIKEKIVTNNLEKFGVTNLNKLNSQKLKIKNTLINKYGVEHHFQLIEIQNKSKKTCLKKYGFEYATQSDIVKNKTLNTNLERYGVSSAMKLDYIKNKTKNTNLERYGVECTMQNIDVFNKHLKNSFMINTYESITYKGSYELDFLKKYYYIGVEKCENIPYFYDGKNRKYFPDFYYRPLNLIIEIKSLYIFNKDFDKNIAKQKACINNGFNFIFIIDKDYNEFDNILDIN